MASDKIDRNMPASVIAEKFGGGTELARAMEPPRAPSTVHRWLEGGYIPTRHVDAVKEAAVRKRIKLRDSDFLNRREPAEATQ